MPTEDIMDKTKTMKLIKAQDELIKEQKKVIEKLFELNRNCINEWKNSFWLFVLLLILTNLWWMVSYLLK